MFESWSNNNNNTTTTITSRFHVQHCATCNLFALHCTRLDQTGLDWTGLKQRFKFVCLLHGDDKCHHLRLFNAINLITFKSLLSSAPLGPPASLGPAEKPLNLFCLTPYLVVFALLCFVAALGVRVK